MHLINHLTHLDGLHSFICKFFTFSATRHFLVLSDMLFTKIACAAALTAVVYANPDPSPANSAATGSTGTTLTSNAVQSGSFNDGSDEIGSAEVGQAKSLTSQNNFINNCAGKTLTNGLQITAGSCNGISKWRRAIAQERGVNYQQRWVIFLRRLPWCLPSSHSQPLVEKLLLQTPPSIFPFKHPTWPPVPLRMLMQHITPLLNPYLEDRLLDTRTLLFKIWVTA